MPPLPSNDAREPVPHHENRPDTPSKRTPEPEPPLIHERGTECKEKRDERRQSIGVLVGDAREFGLDLELARRVVHGHDDLDELDQIRALELLVGEQLVQLVLGGDLVRLAGLALGATECLEKLGPFPSPIGMCKFYSRCQWVNEERTSP